MLFLVLLTVSGVCVVLAFTHMVASRLQQLWNGIIPQEDNTTDKNNRRIFYLTFTFHFVDKPWPQVSPPPLPPGRCNHFRRAGGSAFPLLIDLIEILHGTSFYMIRILTALCLAGLRSGIQYGPGDGLATTRRRFEARGIACGQG